MRLASVLGSLLILGTVSASLAIQSASKQTEASQKKADRIEEVHKGLFGTAPTATDKANQLTTQAAGALPNGSTISESVQRRNFIDEYIFGRMQRDSIPHAGISADEEFVRRVYLDATGQLPTVEEVRSFKSGTEPDKRDRLVDQLVGTDQFAEQWAWFYGDLFRLQSNTGRGKYAFNYWNKEWLRVDRPYNEVVTEVLTGVGKTNSTIPALGLLHRNNILAKPMPESPDDYAALNRLDTLDEFSVDVGRIFLGMNISCISCHDGEGHLEQVNLYLSKKTRDEFFRQSAFQGNVRMVMGWDEGIRNIGDKDFVYDDLGKGYDASNDAPFETPSQIRMPRPSRKYQPVFLLTGERPRPGANPREELARMLTSHIQFRRATVNLVWGKLMTVPFVDPYDSFDLDRMDPKNPPPAPNTLQPTNPELLEALAEDFMTHNYSMQHLIKTIMKSSAYQLSPRFKGVWKDEYTPYYARKFVRVMAGNELVDAITQATDRPEQYTSAGKKVTRINETAGPWELRGRAGAEILNLMQSFFQSNRSTPSGIANRPSTIQTMLMMNSGVVNERVLSKNGSRVEKLLKSVKNDAEIIDELFLASVSRLPTPAEKEVALQEMEKDKARAAENIQWVLLNSIEFVLNH